MLQPKRFSTLMVLALGLFIAGCHPAAGPEPGPTTKNVSLSDVEFAKTVFTQLTEGDTSAVGDIDWEGFKASGMDIGASYRAFKDEPNRQAFRTSFITGYSSSFKKSGATASMLQDWKMAEDKPEGSVVTAKGKSNAVIKLALSKKGGARRLAGIDVVQQN